jgi:endonuclease/exonuclease/phosphatase family metal-dependent hydrolase
LGPLTDDSFAIDLAQLAVPDPMMRWSHYYPKDKTYGALDHIFLSPHLAQLNQQCPVSYIRVGAPWRCERHKGFRLPGVGWTNPIASDHCPLVATIKFDGQPLSE